jgi:hypothetical protein
MHFSTAVDISTLPWFTSFSLMQAARSLTLLASCAHPKEIEKRVPARERTRLFDLNVPLTSEM